nr:unnamed protein product [Callosobruchus analis]
MPYCLKLKGIRLS